MKMPLILVLLFACMVYLSCSSNSSGTEEKDYPHETIQIPDSVKSACDAFLLQKNSLAVTEESYTAQIKVYDSTGEMFSLMQSPCGNSPCESSEQPKYYSWWPEGRYYILRETLLGDESISQEWSCVNYPEVE